MRDWKGFFFFFFNKYVVKIKEVHLKPSFRLPSPRLVVLGLLFRPWGGGGVQFPPSFQWVLFPSRLFSFVNGYSSQFLLGMSSRDQQSAWVFEVGESLKGG
jgi:hypothetical protein